nr:uncharacterized protein LOC121129118 isoform X2 [Lepeophtheirus salmonis]
MKVFIVLASLCSIALAEKPLGGYGAPPLSSYGGPDPLDEYAAGGIAGGEVEGVGGEIVSAGDAGAGTGDAAVDGEGESLIPGVPGEDYPIYNKVPETSFSCEGQIEGGYYADPEAECQAFHICIADGEGSLLKASALCHNGTIFNQETFTCDLWFNFNCADAKRLYSLNEELAAAREEASAALAAAAASSSGTAGDDSPASTASAGGVSAASDAAATAGYGAPAPGGLPSYVV